MTCTDFCHMRREKNKEIKCWKSMLFRCCHKPEISRRSSIDCTKRQRSDCCQNPCRLSKPPTATCRFLETWRHEPVWSVFNNSLVQISCHPRPITCWWNHCLLHPSTATRNCVECVLYWQAIVISIAVRSWFNRTGCEITTRIMRISRHDSRKNADTAAAAV